MSVQEYIAKRIVLKSSGGEYLIPYTNESEKTAVWGSVTGTLEEQADLSQALAAKANTSDTYLKSEVDEKVLGSLRYKGEASSYAALPTEGNVVADVWRVLTANESPKIPANGYVLWEGDKWGVLTGSGSGSGSGGAENGFDWIGTKSEYDSAMEAGTIQSTWICLIIDDEYTDIVTSEYSETGTDPVNGVAVSKALNSLIDDEGTPSEDKVFSSAKIFSIVGNIEALLSTI